MSFCIHVYYVHLCGPMFSAFRYASLHPGLSNGNRVWGLTTSVRRRPLWSCDTVREDQGLFNRCDFSLNLCRKTDDKPHRRRPMTNSSHRDIRADDVTLFTSTRYICHYQRYFSHTTSRDMFHFNIYAAASDSWWNGISQIKVTRRRQM